MPAKHNLEDEIKVFPFTHAPEPTPEYYGICGVCFGDGEAPTFERRNPYEECWLAVVTEKRERDE